MVTTNAGALNEFGVADGYAADAIAATDGDVAVTMQPTSSTSPPTTSAAAFPRG
jgi:hypothetical protein